MFNKTLFRHFRSFIVLIIIVSTIHDLNGQIKLLSVKPSDCTNSYDAYGFKAIYKQTWLNDKILQVHTTASANCIGIHNPRIKLLGPLVYLKFDEFASSTIIDPKTHKKVMSTPLVADCNCVYEITWEIKGLKKGTNYIILLNGQISSDYNKQLLDLSLSNYRIDDNVNYFHLYDAVDKKELKQGLQTFRDSNGIRIELYQDGKKQTNR